MFSQHHLLKRLSFKPRKQPAPGPTAGTAGRPCSGGSRPALRPRPSTRPPDPRPVNSVSGGFAHATSFHVPALGEPALTAVLGRACVGAGAVVYVRACVCVAKPDLRVLQTTCVLLLLPSIFPSITVFSNESVLHITWPNY